MAKRHKWKGDKYSAHCEKCGCYRRKFGLYYEYWLLDKTRSDYAPECINPDLNK